MRFLPSAAVSLVLLNVAHPVLAQQPRPERPYRGLFGGGVGDTAQLLTATGSASGGWNDTVAITGGRVGRPKLNDLNTTFRGGSAQLSGRLTYSLNLSRLSLTAMGATDARYYPSLTTTMLRRNHARVSMSGQVTDWLSGNAFAEYQPYGAAQLLGTSFEASRDASVLADVAEPASLEHYLAYGAGASFMRRLARRVTFSTNYMYRTRTASEADSQFWSQGAGARLTYNVGKGLDLRTGYSYLEGHYPGNETFGSHVIDSGVDFKRDLSLSLSRRVTLSFATGMAATARQRTEEEGARTQFRAIGNVNLVREIGRTWSAVLAYNRNVRFVESWPEPVSSDNVTASVGGLVGRRIQVLSTLGTSTGLMGLDRDAGGFDAYYSTSSLSYGLSRYVTVSLSYSYYHQRFDQTVDLPPGLAGDVDRHSVLGYLTLWAPLFQRSRRTDASR